MNIVRAKSRLGQFPGEGIASDITLGPQDTSTPTDNFPMYYDPGLLIAEQGAPAPAPSATVPKPSSGDTGFLPADAGGWGTEGTTYKPATSSPPAPGQISPAPHVPSAPSRPSSILSSVPTVAWLGIGVVAVLALAGGGRRRR
jgi:hypothetical protein